jgi:hypothetical protein
MDALSEFVLLFLDHVRQEISEGHVDANDLQLEKLPDLHSDGHDVYTLRVRVPRRQQFRA